MLRLLVLFLMNKKEVYVDIDQISEKKIISNYLFIISFS